MLKRDCITSVLRFWYYSIKMCRCMNCRILQYWWPAFNYVLSIVVHCVILRPIFKLYFLPVVGVCTSQKTGKKYN